MGNIKTFTIGEVCEVIAGQSPPSDTYNFEQKGLPFFQGKADFGEIYPVNRMWCDKPIKIAQSGDILLSVRAPVGPTNLCKEKCCIGRGLSAIRPGKDADPKYILYFFRSIEKKLSEQGRGSTFSAITQSEIRNIKIPLPPLPEQKRIAAILDKADAVRRKRQETIRLLDEFLRSVFLEMFGDPVRNEKGWEVVKLIDVCDCMVPGRDKPKSFTGDIPWITIDDLNVFGLTMESKKSMGLTLNEIEEVNRKVVPVGSVLMSCVGNLGITSIAGKEMVINQQLHSYQCSLQINNWFLKYLLPYYKGYMYKMATTTVVPYMNKSVCNSIEIILPPIKIQNSFSKTLSKIQNQRRLFVQSFVEIENGFNSLMQKAFRGSCRV